MALSTLVLVLAGVFIVGILPLYIIVKILGGEITLLKALGIKIVAAVIAVLLSLFLGSIGPLVVAVAMIILYKAAFNLGTIRALIAWFLEGVVLVLLVLLLSFLGIVALTWNSLGVLS